MAAATKNSVPVFTIKKKHAWRDQALKISSLLLVVLVLSGTGVWFLLNLQFDWGGLLSNSFGQLKPQVQLEEKIETQSKEEELEILIDKDKILKISTIGKTPEGDLQLQAESGPQVFFAVEKSLKDQVATLQTLLTKAKIENKALKKVDFRFDKVVVEY